MRHQKTRPKKRCPKPTALGKEILAALSELTDALKKGEVAAHLRKRDGVNHKRKSPRVPSRNGKIDRV